MSDTPRIRITRRYAEWRSDAISVSLPADIDPHDHGAIYDWGLENYDRLLSDAEAAGDTDSDAEIEWLDEYLDAVDNMDDEIDAELL
jgi:hypothetical protein